MSATLSPCGRYRYRLERTTHGCGATFAFFGVNPSTADALVDDATVRKWRGFVWKWSAWRFLVGNAFAYRATDVRELQRVADPVGPDNDFHIGRIAAEADILVPCWGDRKKLPHGLRTRLDTVLATLHATGKPVQTFGLTQGGDPMHPLMLPYATKLQEMPR